MDYSMYETDEDGALTPAGVAAEVRDLSRKMISQLLLLASGKNAKSQPIEHDVSMIYALDDLQGTVADLSDAVAGDNENNREIVIHELTKALGLE